ncbi:MAG TPA: cob(I)yrinic acid a,c-diamide adenosyltransferase [Acidimicrobiales bacterium]|nr:cob(I)yrinic acid a,c-diamide adenosyltransferase [Acidimicrobiales bacterium]
MKIYTRKGDDGTTGLYFGGRVRKDDPAPRAYGAVDEAQAFLGVARAEAERGGELDELLLRIERDLYVCMAELATSADNRHKLGELITDEQVASLEPIIDDLMARFPMPTEFVLPGQTRTAAALDVARTVVRRAERESLAVAPDDSRVVAYLNRLSDLLWAAARWQEAEAGTILAKET